MRGLRLWVSTPRGVETMWTSSLQLGVPWEGVSTPCGVETLRADVSTCGELRWWVGTPGGVERVRAGGFTCVGCRGELWGDRDDSGVLTDG